MKRERRAAILRILRDVQKDLGLVDCWMVRFESGAGKRILWMCSGLEKRCYIVVLEFATRHLKLQELKHRL